MEMRISTNKKREALANGITQHQSKEKVKDKKVEKRAKSDAKKREFPTLDFQLFQWQIHTTIQLDSDVANDKQLGLRTSFIPLWTMAVLSCHSHC